MQIMFWQSFETTFFAVLKILLILIVAGVLVRRGIITSEILKSLSTSMVRVFLPCLIFSNIVMNFNPSKLKIWPLLPASAVFMVVLGISSGVLLFFRDLKRKRNLLALCSMQNAGYFILPMGAVLFPENIAKFNLYCFLYILGISPLIWSLGKFLSSSGHHTENKISFKAMITPPLIANITAVILVFTGLRAVVPGMVIDSTDLLGRAAVPVAIFILGGMLGSVKLKFDGYTLDAIKVIAVKMLILPAVVVALLHFTSLNSQYPLLSGFLVLQASAAPATAILMQVKHYGGDEQKISSITLLCYLCCVITIPLWMSIWKIML